MSISDNQLASNVIGLREVVCQSICSMAPGAAIAASILFGSPLAGGALPLAVVFGFIGILFTASSIGQLTKHIPAAGSVATYSVNGLRPWLGHLVGWAYAAVEILIVPLVMLQLGYTVAGEWNADAKGFHGWSGVIAGSVFTLLAFSPSLALKQPRLLPKSRRIIARMSLKPS